MNTSITVDNLKCGGCANTITKKLSALDGVSNVQVDKDTSIITYDYNEDSLVELVETTLAKLGYPKQGTGTLGQKAKSYISCATGKIDM